MPTYNFEALDSSGAEKTGSVDADTESAALVRIREKGMFPTRVTEAGVSSSKRKRKKKAAPKAGKRGVGGAMSMNISMPAMFSRVKPKLLMVFTRQLSTLISAGMPLLRCLQVLDKQEKNPALKKVIAQLEDGIQTGGTFAESLGNHPKIFNRLYVNMVKAGELGGILDVVLNRLAEFMEKAQRIKGKVVSAMVYPVVVLCLSFAILAFLMIYVVPKFEEIFADLLEGGELPALTRFVTSVSSSFGASLPFLALGIVTFVVLLKMSRRFDGGRLALDGLKLNMPLFGSLMRKASIARFTRTLGTLMTSGVPVLQALTIVKETAGNEVVSRAVGEVHHAVKEGENIAPPMDASGVFPPIVISMVEVGEETGELPEMLNRIADNYDEEVDNAVAGLTSIIEPLLIVFLALIVGTIVIALFLPLTSVIGQLSG